MTEPAEFRKPEERGLNRILALSDGVFAFAITLLVLDLVVPALGSNQDSSALSNILAGEWNSFFNYFLSFTMIAAWWNTHQRYFEYVNSYDGRLKVLNLLALLTITLIPFFTKLLDSWNSAPLATVLYAVNQGATGTFLAIILRYTSKNHRFIDERLNQKVINRMQVTSVIPPMFFFFSIPLAYVEPAAAWTSWYAIFPISYILRRKYSK
jgi:uncharacterized membrane protein